MSTDDWATINSTAFLATVLPAGPAAENIHLPISFRKRRFPPQRDTMQPGGMNISDDGQRLAVWWHPFTGWRDVTDGDGTHYGNLYVIAPIRDTYMTWPVEKLRRPGEAGRTDSVNTGDWTEYADVMDIIFRGKLHSPVEGRNDPKGSGYRPPEGALCGFWVGTWPGAADQRRSDVLPWRYRALTSEPVPPPTPPQPWPGPVGSPLTDGEIRRTMVRLVELLG